MYLPKRSGLLLATLLLGAGFCTAQAAEEAAAEQQEEAQSQQAQTPSVTADMLLRAISAQRTAEAEANSAREQRFRSARDAKQAQLNKAKSDRDAAEARSNALDAQYDQNEKRIDEISNQLNVSQGNLGELFGVTRQISGDVAGDLTDSLTNTQIEIPAGTEGRIDLLRRLAAATALPDIDDLEALWLVILDELKMDGEVTRYTAPVLLPDGVTTEEREVVRVGAFQAFTNGTYLGYQASENQLFEFERQPETELRRVVRNLQAARAEDGAGYQRAVIDPSSGALMSLYVERPSFLERISEGEAVGYVIVAVGLIGVLVAIIQYFYLFFTKFSVARQLRNLTNPTPNNPLGRLILSANNTKETETAEVLEMRIADSMRRETPRLERFQAFLRLAVAAGPLLGLIGTVIGMIITFESITASGSSDPKLMAQGIGQAMIATVLGLGVAIPLLFLNSGLTRLSTGLM
ncbi:MAG TPA: MotA/TolQ/ExbB proton channel family protein, partial [Hyphomicrobiales bacterium]|nr:MotA/TolQ/ExbB proton channel family protein [Hyphomicrobiales bacterium]